MPYASARNILIIEGAGQSALSKLLETRPKRHKLTPSGTGFPSSRLKWLSDPVGPFSHHFARGI